MGTASRTILLDATLTVAQQKVEMKAELGNLLLGDIIQVKSVNNDPSPKLDIVTNFWVRTEPGKGGFLGIGGGKGKKTRQPLVFSFADSRLEKKLTVKVGDKWEPLPKNENDGGQLMASDNGEIRLEVTASYADPGPPPGNGYVREDAGLYRAPQNAKLKIEITRQE